jgi:hypothetical protein
MIVFIVNPQPIRIVWFVRVKQTVHPIPDARRHIPKLGVLDPVLSGVPSQWEVLDAVAIDTGVQLEENTKTSLRKDGMCRFELDMMARDFAIRLRESVRHQVLLDRVVGKLNNPPRITVLDYVDQTGACRHHCLFLIRPPQTWVQYRGCPFVEVNDKDFCKFLDAKGMDGHHEALHESMGDPLVRLTNTLQYLLVCLI